MNVIEEAVYKNTYRFINNLDDVVKVVYVVQSKIR